MLEYCHGGDLFGLMGMYDDEILPVESAQFCEYTQRGAHRTTT